MVGAHVKSTYDGLGVLELGAAYRDSPSSACCFGTAITGYLIKFSTGSGLSAEYFAGNLIFLGINFLLR